MDKMLAVEEEARRRTFLSGNFLHKDAQDTLIIVETPWRYPLNTLVVASREIMKVYGHEDGGLYVQRGYGGTKIRTHPCGSEFVVVGYFAPESEGCV